MDQGSADLVEKLIAGSNRNHGMLQKISGNQLERMELYLTRRLKVFRNIQLLASIRNCTEDIPWTTITDQ